MSPVLQVEMAQNDSNLPQQAYPDLPATPDSSHYEASTRALDLRELGAAISSDEITRVTEFLDEQNRSRDVLNAGLSLAVKAANIKISEFLLARGAEITSAVVGSAVKARSQAIFKLLVDHGWQVNAPFGAGHVVLPKVVGDKQLTRWLLDTGADPNLGAPMWGDIQTDSPPNPNSHEALNRAAGISSMAIFDLLVQHGAKIENCSALHSAAASQSREAECVSMISHLLDLGFDVNGLDDVHGPYAFGRPLHYAVRSRNLGSVRYLLERGANPNLRNQMGDSAYDEAVRRRFFEAVELFKEGIENP
ncbi:uncharacterized protein PAC_17656 [Phialocephala subalpina]|uniref:Uncharacterized protein n=1 Tax=Phialocephala subalpina TaxID=576137 RepID=A0A1L7XS38_9HELO|nr:uncharacterized protein PAC_17656 [Phialocephala subalpina]